MTVFARSAPRDPLYPSAEHREVRHDGYGPDNAACVAGRIGRTPGQAGRLRPLVVDGGGSGSDVAEELADWSVQFLLVVVLLTVAGDQAIDTDPA